jgi:UDP:flavonoid glycosyltransferase YjiC (YdhE family)
LRFVDSLSREEYDEINRDPDLWHPTRGLRIVLRAIAERMRTGYDLLDPLYDPGRTVIVGHTLAFATRMFQEKRGVPSVTIHLAPSAFRSINDMPTNRPGRDFNKLPTGLRRAMWWFFDRALVDPHITRELNRWREELGLPRISRPFREWIHSPQGVIGMFPDWFGPSQSDWPPLTHLTGFPLFDEVARQPLNPELEEFLEEEDPPIVFTPGTANRQARRFFETAARATARLGRRAIFLTAYPEQLPRSLAGHVRHETYVPFSRVLPRCAALVHHGGIGTSAQGLAAGVPQLVMAMGFDQPDNARRLGQLGVGASVIPRQFKPGRVARMVGRLLTDRNVAEACDRCRDLVRAENPVERTCDLIEMIGRTGTLPPGRG